jgi:hypothetical protein
MAGVNKLARTVGKDPFLVYGFRFEHRDSRSPKQTSLSIFLKADRQVGTLRRGRVLNATVRVPSGREGKASWVLTSTSAYAQVSATEQSIGDRIGRRDWRRPFTVVGSFSDEALASLEPLIHSSPERPPLPNGEPSGKVDGSLPIISVRRVAEGVDVRLGNNDLSGVYVLMAERDGLRIVLQHSFWIV